MTKEELGTLILNSERQLYSTAKTILINDQDCADAIQETIVKAFSKIGTLRNDKYAKTWLIRILINECYTLLRKSSKLVSLEGMSEMTEIEADQKTDHSDLYRAVNSLKEELRMPVILYYIEDFNIKEIAQILEITEGAVQKRLARARGKLKRNLQESEVLTFADKNDYEKVQEDDRISVLGLNEFAPGKPLTVVLKHTDGTTDTFAAVHTYNGAQIEWFKSGSALNYSSLAK